MNSFPLWVAQCLASAFLAVLFLQSGLDKVFDWKGNKDYIGGFFAKTFLARFSTFLLFQVTVLEVLAGVTAAAGVLTLVLTRSSAIAFGGAVLASVNMLALFFGMRIAKDYASAAGIMPYAIFAIGSVLVQGANL